MRFLLPRFNHGGFHQQYSYCEKMAWNGATQKLPHGQISLRFLHCVTTSKASLNPLLLNTYRHNQHPLERASLLAYPGSFPFQNYSNSQQYRHLGYGTNWKLTSKGKKKKRRPLPRSKNDSAAKQSSSSSSSRPKWGDKSRQQLEKEFYQKVKAQKAKQAAPHAFLVRTASPNVYVSELATSRSDIDPHSLFSDVVFESLIEGSDGQPETVLEYVKPAIFAGGKNSFRFFSPEEFKYELPNLDVKEVAFLGRSNVGKSSLINGLMSRKLAKTSKQPGRTQLPYYFGLVPNETNTSMVSGSAGKEKGSNLTTHLPLGFFVDLPGYGFAVGPDAAVDEWQRKTQDFLLDRRASGHLQRVFLLVDARHGATKLDTSVMGWLEEGKLPFSVVLTKVDAVAAPMRVKWANLLCARYQHRLLDIEGDEEELPENKINYMSPVIHMTSAQSGLGMAELLSSIEAEWL